MIAAVDVDDVELVYLVKVMFGEIGGENVGSTGIKAAAQYRRQARLAETILIGPLPVIFKLGRIRRLVVCGIEVVHSCSKAGIHDAQVLIGECDIDHQFRLLTLQERGEFSDIVGIHLCRANRPFYLCGNGLALGLGAAGEHDVGKNGRQLGTLVGHHGADATRSNNNDSGHNPAPV